MEAISKENKIKDHKNHKNHKNHKIQNQWKFKNHKILLDQNKYANNNKSNNKMI